MDRESASTVLGTPLAQELLRSSPLAHLAYIGRYGYPRVIPTGYVWKGGSSWCALRTTHRKCGASNLIPGSPSPLILKPSRHASCSCVARQAWRSSTASRTTTSRLRTSTFPERSGRGSTRRFAAYIHEWRASASRPNGQSSSTSRRRFPRPSRSCWLSTSSCHEAPLRAQQNLDRAALVHRAVRFGDLVESQGQVKDLAWTYLSVPHQVDQLGQEAAHWGGATVEVDMGEEQLVAIELDPMRDADVAHGPTRAGGTNRLHHRLLGAHALQHRVSTDSVGQLLGAGHAIVTALRHDGGCAKLGGQPLPRLVTAHRDDPLGAPSARRREHRGARPRRRRRPLPSSRASHSLHRRRTRRYP